MEEPSYLTSHNESNVRCKKHSREKKPEKKSNFRQRLLNVKLNSFPNVPTNDNVHVAQQALAHKV